ncbi:conserved hypothetical protein [Dehalogenimonas lykanthroporepellens BL-DC-9]|jgi:hypothetical protein|nr:conserved hypothetical protein [Dehalogenimonas lykanthroporepellens BL-DC-9]
MKTGNGTLLAILGGVIGVVGFAAFQRANEIISQGDALLSFGWFFSDISRDDATILQMAGIGGMVLGAILLIVGLMKVYKSR